MNDSFLEDLGLIPEESKKTYHQADCHITTRHATSSPLVKFSEQDERENIMRPHKMLPTITVQNMPDVRISGNKDPVSKDSKKQFEQGGKKHSAKVRVSEKIEKAENRAKTIDAKGKVDNNQQQSVAGEARTKLQEIKHLKVSENKTVSKERARRSVLYKEATHPLGTFTKENKRSPDSSNSRSSDASSKDNTRPSDSSKENGPQEPIKEKEKGANSGKTGYNMQDHDPVVLLTAIKELISTYTKQETSTILRTMQELHINSQATLIKSFLTQTDDLIKEMHPSKNSARVKMLVEENEFLQQELIALKAQNEDLQHKLEDFEFLKQENAALKLKCDELTRI